MGNPEDEALSDLEDDAAPMILPVSAAPAISHAERLKSLLQDLDSERQARKEAESAKGELLERLRAMSRQKDEALKQKEETQNDKEELTKKLHEVLQLREEAIRQRDAIAHERDEAVKARDESFRLKDEASKARETMRSEVEAAARLLVSGAERITTKATSIQTFTANLPRSASHTGVAAIAYGFAKRADDVVDELVRQHESAMRSRSEMHEQMEQRNYQIAIEVSELEASIQNLKEELSKKSQEIEKLQKLSSGKDGKISEIEQVMLKRLSEAQNEAELLRKDREEAKQKIHRTKDLLLELLHLIYKANEVLGNISSTFSIFQSDKGKSAFFPVTDSDLEEGFIHCISRSKDLVDLCLRLGSTWKEHRDLQKKEFDSLHATIMRLEAEKKEITTFLWSALANMKEALSHSGRTNDDGGSDGIISLGDQFKTGEAVSMAVALENEITGLREEIFELQQLLATARGELEALKVTSECQADELSRNHAQIHDFEENYSIAQDKIESLKLDLAVVQQELVQWKQASTNEAESRSAVVEELERCQEENSALLIQIEQLRLSLDELNGKLRSKEEIVMAAVAAQNAAERSLRIADKRAVELRERVEELTRQFDALEAQGDNGFNMGLFSICWPYQWLRGRPLSFQRSIPPQREAEMEELLEPLV